MHKVHSFPVLPLSLHTLWLGNTYWVFALISTFALSSSTQQPQPFLTPPSIKLLVILFFKNIYWEFNMVLNCEWKKIFANYIADKRLISKVYKELIQLNSKKNQTIQLKNGQRNRIGIFPKKTYKCQQAHEKVLNITNHQGNANAVTSHLSEWLSSKRQEITSVGENAEKGNTCTLLVGM